MAAQEPDPRQRYEVPQRSTRERVTCTKKERYDTKGRARYRVRKLGMKYYACRFCGGYHLTNG